ncbi:MAG: hypothetical protein FWF41_08560 [Betaproteobacteria bacterium]|nr:hypothetical protein [Betaproteobacteria bacterium]
MRLLHYHCPMRFRFMLRKYFEVTEALGLGIRRDGKLTGTSEDVCALCDVLFWTGDMEFAVRSLFFRSAQDASKFE